MQLNYITDPVQVFPASAGMNRLSITPLLQISGVPRECGDEPALPVDASMSPRCSPRVRG